MNDEEKKAIEFYKEYIRNNEKLYFRTEIIENVSILLNLIAKQENEINHFKSLYHTVDETSNRQQKEIEELKKEEGEKE